MPAPLGEVLDRAIVREVAAVFHAKEDLDAAINDLLVSGFDRSDIDLMADFETVAEKLGSVFVPAEEVADIPATPRRAYIARDDIKSVIATSAGILFYVGASALAIGVVASGGTLAAAIAAGLAGGALSGGIGALAARHIGQELAHELEMQILAGGLVVWVRARSPENEELARLILQRHGGAAVRVHDITIEKRLEDIPLSAVRPDPWLGDKTLGDI